MKNNLRVKIIFLVAILSFTLCLWACQKKETEPEKTNDPNNITVFSDIHILSSEQYGDTITPGLQRLLYRNEKAIGLTEAIFKTAIDDFIAGNSEILLITGDLTDDGAKVAHQAVARELRRAEQAGKRCYVVNGNHDINNHSTSYVEENARSIDNVSAEEFAEIYAEFGFNEALVRDTNSLSYTVDLNQKYRLIAWDIAKYDLVPGTDRDVIDRHDPHVTDEGLEWLETQLDACFTDEKEPLLITHFPILSHIGPLVGSMSHVNRQSDVLSVLNSGNVSFSFCGHVHQQDIATYSFSGRNYYEIETGSLSYTNLPVRHFYDDGTEVKITTTQQQYVKEEYIPAFYPAEEKARILADLPSYVWKYESSNFANYAYEKLYYDDVCGVFGIDDEELWQLTEEIVKAFYYTPLYEKDANGGKSLEGICKSYGVTDFPLLDDAKTIGELLAFFIKTNFAGDENIQTTTPEAIQFKYALYAACYTFADTQLLSRLDLIPEYDKTASMQMISDLFRSGKVEVVESGVLGVLSKIKALRKNDIAQGILSGTPEETAQKIQLLLSKVDSIASYLPTGTIKDLVLSLYDEEEGLSYLIDFTDVAETGKGYISIDGVFDVLFKVIGKGLLYDDGATDNNFTFPSPTLNYFPSTENAQ